MKVIGRSADLNRAARPELCIAAQYACAGSGGIARVVRLMTKVTCDEGIKMILFAAAEAMPVADLGVRMRTFNKNRLTFAAACQLAGFGARKIIYDFAGTARAHPFIGKPYALWIHGAEVWEGARATRLRAIRNAETVFANSHFTCNKAEQLHGGFARAKICWLATFEDEPIAMAAAASRPANVLILARLDADRYKGHDALLKAWPKVVAKVPEARLLIAGSGPLQQQVAEVAQASPVAGTIEMLGHIGESELPQLWARTRIFAMPSFGEGFGLVYVEAMRFGVPVIASVHDAGAEINIDGVTGYNVDQRNDNDLAGRIIDLLKDPLRVRRFGQAANERWEAEFRYSCFRRRFAPLLHEFLAS